MSTPIEQAWRLQKQWSTAATTQHDKIERSRWLNLTLLVVAATTSALGALLHDHVTVVRLAGVASAGVLSLAGLVQQRRLGAGRIATWVAMRLAAERLKAAVWRELALSSDDPTGSSARLVEAVEKANHDVADQATALLTTPAPQGGPPSPGFDGYVAKRASEQANWHRTKGAMLLARAQRLRRVELAVTIIGIVVSALAGAYATAVLTPIVGALTTVAATLAAHLSASKFERIAAGYALTATDLDLALTGLGAAPRPTECAAFVDRVESILLRQNVGWIALLSAE